MILLSIFEVSRFVVFGGLAAAGAVVGYAYRAVIKADVEKLAAELPGFVASAEAALSNDAATAVAKIKALVADLKAKL